VLAAAHRACRRAGSAGAGGSRRRPALAVFAVALAIRLLALWAARDAELVLDEQTYALRAEALLEGRGFLGSYQSWVRHDASKPVELPQYPGAWQPPGYTVFAAALLGVSGGSLFAVKLGQVLLGSLSVLLVLALGRAWFGERAGLAAAWLAALYPNLVAFTHYLWSETLFVFLLLAGLVALSRRDDPPRPQEAALAGLLLGAAALTRAAIVYFLPVLSAWLVVVHRRRPRAALVAAAIVPAAALLAILPWTVRNTLLHGGFVLIETNAPYNLWRGNGPGALEDRCAPEVPHYPWPFECLPISPVGNRYAWVLVADAKRALGKDDPSDLELIRYAQGAAWAEIRAHPETFARRILPRLVDLWNPTSFLVRHLHVGAYGPVHPVLATLLAWAAILAYLAAAALALAGAWLERRNAFTWLVALLALFYSGITALSFGLTRFRLPLEALLLVLAGPALVALRARRARRGAAALATAGLALAGCGREAAAPRRAPDAPDFLVILWDTARADRMSLYGHARSTTPRLDAWARGARVFENATSAAGHTLPSHASLFTGLLPSEHCVHHESPRLDDRFATLAELLRGAGYQTFLYSENPHVAAGSSNLAQGFDAVEHPWSPARAEAARRIVLAKLPPEDRSSELPERLAASERGLAPLSAWNIKAAGELAEQAVVEWLERRDPARPWFVFVNYMEAHRPTIPPRRFRERMLPPAEVDASYRVDRSWLPTWEYTFGLREMGERELELTRATYDAALAELDELTAGLLEALESRGLLADAGVVLTSDHGELLGEHHMLDHQYALHEELLRVPLVVRGAKGVAPGRDLRPVANFDVFATLLELAGIEPPPGTKARSLLAPLERRPRLAEEPATSSVGIDQVRAAHPGFDPSPFQRRLRAWTDEPHKYVWSSDGRHALYDLARDPGEGRDLSGEQAALAARLAADLDAYQAALSRCAPAPPAPDGQSPQEIERLRALGYAVGGPEP
jgi:arylsulfatase A-like enzyme/4-amino-4-deoxy-L-arabinose transferase-like glycosyltransferase